MITDKTKKIQAYKKLMKIAQDGSVELYIDSADRRKGPKYAVKWKDHLIHTAEQYGRQKALDSVFDILVNCSTGCYPKSLDQMEKERLLARTILDAVSPNSNRRHFIYGRYFDMSVLRFRSDIALEIAKSDVFLKPVNLDMSFDRLSDDIWSHFHSFWNHARPEELTSSESAISTQLSSARKELISLLFQKEIYPRDVAVFEKLAPIVLEKDPEFFNKKKEQAIMRIAQAKTPVQIYNTLIDNRKEKTK